MSIQLWRGHGQEAKRGEAVGQRITRNVKRLGCFSSRVRPTGVFLLADWYLIGTSPRGQPWTPVVTLPHGCDGLSVRRELMRNVLSDFTPIIPATACHQRNYVETDSRFT
jgi:hypothetical protein